MAKIKNPLPITVDWQGPNGREFYLDDQIKKNKFLSLIFSIKFKLDVTIKTN